ncbi:MAG: 50S ribosomal protein L9 [Parcubacteria group bacterium]
MAKKPVAVLLRKDVKGLGKSGELVRVSPGYVRNFLVPTGAGLIATTGLIAAHQAALARQRQENIQTHTSAQKTAKNLSNKILTLRVKAGQKGKLFGSVTRAEIVQALENQLGLKVEPKQLLLDQPLKKLGKHNITIRLASSVDAALSVQILSAKS